MSNPTFDPNTFQPNPFNTTPAGVPIDPATALNPASVTSTPVDTSTVPSLGDPVSVPVVPVAPVTVPDPALSAPSYTPPSPVASNQDIAALIAQAVQQALVQQQAQQVASTQPKVLTPEEQIRAVLDNAGSLLGVEERLTEIYACLALIAQKVGI